MANTEKYDDLIIGSGIAGKFAAWTRDSRSRIVGWFSALISPKRAGDLRPTPM